MTELTPRERFLLSTDPYKTIGQAEAEKKEGKRKRLREILEKSNVKSNVKSNLKSNLKSQMTSPAHPVDIAVHIEHLHELKKVLESEQDKAIPLVWSVNLYDTFGRLKSFPELNDIVIDVRDEPPYTFVNKVYRWKDDDGNPVHKKLETTCNGRTMRDVWLAANELYERAEKECGDWHYFLEIIDREPIDENKFYLYYGS